MDPAEAELPRAVLGGVSEAEASRILKKAGGSTKTAIVMLRRGLSREEALALLEKSGGMLRGALES